MAATSTTSPSKTSLSSLKVPELKALCTKHGLPVSGNKGELINRLSEFYESTSKQPTTDSESPLPQPVSKKPEAVDPTTTGRPTTTGQPTTPQVQQPKPTTATRVPEENIKSVGFTPTTTIKETSKDPSTETDSGSKNELIQAEITKRKQRAERFGLGTTTMSTINNQFIKQDDPEHLKKLERAKKFGIPLESVIRLDAIDRPLTTTSSDQLKPLESTRLIAVDPDWEDKKRKRAEKFGLVDHPNPSGAINPKKFNRPRY